MILQNVCPSLTSGKSLTGLCLNIPVLEVSSFVILCFLVSSADKHHHIT
jgi:hypothetical protein